MKSRLLDLEVQRNNFLEALRQNDLPTLNSLISDQATIHLNQGAEIKLEQGRVSEFAPLLRSYIKEFGRNMDYVKEGDSWAVEHGHFTSKVIEGQTRNVADYQGKYNLLWQKGSAEQWKIAKISCLFARPTLRHKVA